MPAGRKRKPTELLEREGNPGKRALPARVVVDDRAPVKPANLGAAGSKLWDDVVGPLAAVGVVQRIDTATLTALCVQWDIAEKARAVLAKEGHYVAGSTGQVVEHPALAILNRAHTMFLKLAAEFALTAAARARIAEAMAGVAASMSEVEKNAIVDLDTPEEV